MNIKEAKLEIQHTIQAYLHRDAAGRYTYPVVRQRPILLMGPPGIGKTAILEQVAQENDVALVAYAMTHHTRQSAVGLPRIETRTYGGQPMTVTEYTVSEIIGAVYETMERTGKQEGILFLDEVNCVSETLAPTMLQLLQNKTFGSHKVPEGWIIVTAGNPPAYNKSVREFDVATLDRVRTIQVEADCGVWLDYARARQVHGAILSYLTIRPQDFYLVEEHADGKNFVTARGWEDLSQLLFSYEALQIPVTRELVREFLQKEEVANSFAAYFQLFQKYREDYGIPALLAGTLAPEAYERKVSMGRNGSFEERFTVVQLLLDALDAALLPWQTENRRLHGLHQSLKQLQAHWQDGPGALAAEKQHSLDVRLQAGLVTQPEREGEQWTIDQLQAWDLALRKDHLREPAAGFARLKELFSARTEAFAQGTEKLSRQLERAFAFAETCFGEGQELVLLVTELAHSERAMGFITQNGCPAFLRHRQVLLFQQEERRLQAQCRDLTE